MTLWTPNPKTVDPIPLCSRCGGLRRDWHRANRARLGVGWLHGVCCCGPCGGGIRIEFKNVTLCNACISPSSGKLRVNGPFTLNGVYTVPFNQITGSYCQYLSTLGSAFYASEDRYPSSGCAGTPTNCSPLLGLISVTTYTASGNLRQVLAEHQTGNSGSCFFGSRQAFTQTEVTDSVTTLNNSITTCPAAATQIAYGGTVEIV